MVEGAGAQVPVDPDLRGPGAEGRGIVHRRPEEQNQHIQDNIEGERIQRPLRDVMVQRVALQQRQRQVHRRAAQAAEEHDHQRPAVLPDKGEEPRNPEEGQGSPFILFFHHATSSLLRL